MIYNTISGKEINLLNINPENICIEDAMWQLDRLPVYENYSWLERIANANQFFINISQEQSSHYSFLLTGLFYSYNYFMPVSAGFSDIPTRYGMSLRRALVSHLTWPYNRSYATNLATFFSWEFFTVDSIIHQHERNYFENRWVHGCSMLDETRKKDNVCLLYDKFNFLKRRHVR
jgi:hypothetical protein